MKNKRVLILHENIGFGHTKVAGVIRDEIKIKHPEIEVKYVEVLGETYPWAKNIVEGIYLGILRIAPWAWEFLHQSKSSEGGNKFFINIFITLMERSFRRIIDDFKPDLIVTSYAFSAGVVSRLKDKGYNIPLMGISTDFYLHEYWNYPNVDKFLVPAEASKKDFSKKGVNKKRMIVTGTPVNRKFLMKTSTIDARRKLGFNSKLPTVMVIGGGTGLGKLNIVMEILDNIDKEIQIVVITGTNKRLYDKLKEKKFKHKVNILGFIDNINEVMDVSDFVIGKAGGSLLSESIAKRLPPIIYGNLPAQERLNAKYIVDHKMGYLADNEDKLEKIIKKILNNSKQLSNYKKNMEVNSMDRASEKILKVIIQTLK